MDLYSILTFYFIFNLGYATQPQTEDSKILLR